MLDITRHITISLIATGSVSLESVVYVLHTDFDFGDLVKTNDRCGSITFYESEARAQEFIRQLPEEIMAGYSTDKPVRT